MRQAEKSPKTAFADAQYIIMLLGAHRPSAAGSRMMMGRWPTYRQEARTRDVCCAAAGHRVDDARPHHASPASESARKPPSSGQTPAARCRAAVSLLHHAKPRHNIGQPTALFKMMTMRSRKRLTHAFIAEL